MTLAIITYDHNHLKTEQILMGLASHGEAGVEVFGIPFTPRPERDVLIHHRPDQAAAGRPKDVCKALGYAYRAVNGILDIPPDFELYMIAGAGLLPEAFVHGKKILNIHPGLIPWSKGLDSFKWSIADRLPLGVTLHYIDERVDEGEVLASRRTPVLPGDTIDILARRHYDLEIQMMVDYRKIMADGGVVGLGLPPGEAHRRMPLDQERTLLEGFSAYVEAMTLTSFG